MKRSAPQPMGSYAPDDVTFLLKNLQNVALETSTEDREEAIQGGVHYSEMLPVEYRPTPEYLDLFHETLRQTAEKVALAAGTAAELIVRKRGTKVVLASLARAGTPAGILIKRYLQQVYGISLPHYSISIIRGRGIDENAILYILQTHSDCEIQFVDGWTGKGAIAQVLAESCADFAKRHHIELNSDLAVLADPGACTETFGTREDFLIPSACLNSTVSGLISRTVLREDLIGPDDFHGAKYYEEWAGEDVSRLFVDTVSRHFPAIAEAARRQADQHQSVQVEASWRGLHEIRRLQAQFGIDDINLVKPGVGETTRVLLRRVPWKILVDSLDNPNLKHILLLAADRQVPVEVSPELSYSCCGLIRSRKGDAE
ncbi:RNA binding Pelota-like protein [Tumebacillus sp. BK434]|uniref:cysteine protease StiP family protein n=1 Tax=Tumebacillus sp. BK434 TaxID=2512169 RepID=UPI001053407A|nr:cysteine protease StiP family protein [Tumebacillus sp. BK434]TCP57927.1 RNA binding Pelota-like protein [Tumebacillus sp. BK434]